MSGSSVATPHGSGSILLNFDHEEQNRNSGAAQSRLPVAPPPQQQGGCFVRLSVCLSVHLPALMTAACCRTHIGLQPDRHQQFTISQVCRSSTPRYTRLPLLSVGTAIATMTTVTLCSSGLLPHGSRVTAKRQRESERDGPAEREPNCPLKMQRQTTEVSPLVIFLHLAPPSLCFFTYCGFNQIAQLAKGAPC